MPNPHPQNSQRLHTASDDTRRAFLHGDREDLLAVLTLRFGSVPEYVQARIAACDNPTTLERWILVAANVPDWDAFLSDLDAGPQAFKLVGASYEPVAAESESTTTPRTVSGESEPREPRSPDGARPKEE